MSLRCRVPLLLALSVIARNAPGQGTIKGSVTDSAGRAIANADVLLKPASKRTRTDSTGRFVLTPLSNGSYTVTARKLGYSPDSYDVRLSTGGAVDVKLVLSVSALDTLKVLAAADCSLYTLDGFFCRRRGGGGLYLDYPDIDDRGALFKGDLFRGLDGFHVTLQSTQRGVLPIPERSNGTCLLYIVDGRVVGSWNGVPLYTRDLAAMEIYVSPDSVPKHLRRITTWDLPRQTRTGRCSVAYFWTIYAPYAKK